MKHIPWTFCLIPALALGLQLNGQITPVGTVEGAPGLLVVRSLPSAGVKLYTSNSTSTTLYNLDLSVYATISYPPLPEDVDYYSPLYITENTFDTDPSSIEVMVMTIHTDGASGTRVIRDDGTILFENLSYAQSGVGGYDEVNAKPPLFSDENGQVYMLLTSYPAGPQPHATKLYTLPGVLPCLDCGGIGMGVEPSEMTGGGSELGLFPNPTTGDVTVTYTLPTGTGKAQLLLHDAAGREVARHVLDASGRASLSVNGLASGTYRCNLLVNERVRGSRTLLVP